MNEVTRFCENWWHLRRVVKQVTHLTFSLMSIWAVDIILDLGNYQF